jgi:uncharacterized protein
VSRTQAFCAPLQSRAAAGFLWIYKRVLAPTIHAGMPGACCFQPTCSEYAAIALAEHGLFRGGGMAAWRVLRCHPLNRGGFDPVRANTRDRVQGTGDSKRSPGNRTPEWAAAHLRDNR